MQVHERVWERAPDPRRVPRTAPEWKPKGTYGLLIAIGVVWMLQWVVLENFGWPTHTYIFAVTSLWWLQPWSLITSTLSHATIDAFGRVAFSHILFNGVALFFFGRILEQIIGTRKFVALFFISGAVSGILQVTLDPGAALGASGAIMMIFGTLAVLMPKEKVMFNFLIPIPFWALAILYAALDILGAINPHSAVGNFAHLSGMALGVWYGFDLKKRARQRSVAWVGR